MLFHDLFFTVMKINCQSGCWWDLLAFKALQCLPSKWQEKYWTHLFTKRKLKKYRDQCVSETTITTTNYNKALKPRRRSTTHRHVLPREAPGVVRVPWQSEHESSHLFSDGRLGLQFQWQPDIWPQCRSVVLPVWCGDDLWWWKEGRLTL